jgi:hypothetical protein
VCDAQSFFRIAREDIAYAPWDLACCVGGDITIIVQGHHNVSLDLLPSATLDSLFNAQVEVLLNADVSLLPSFGGMDDR